MNVQVFNNISPENELNKMQVMDGFNLLITCDEPCCPDGEPPAADQGR